MTMPKRTRKQKKEGRKRYRVGSQRRAESMVASNGMRSEVGAIRRFLGESADGLGGSVDEVQAQ